MQKSKTAKLGKLSIVFVYTRSGRCCAGLEATTHKSKAQIKRSTDYLRDSRLSMMAQMYHWFSLT
jgi:hypothetical protein